MPCLKQICASGVGLVLYATGHCHLVYHDHSDCCCLALNLHHKSKLGSSRMLLLTTYPFDRFGKRTVDDLVSSFATLSLTSYQRRALTCKKLFEKR